MAPRHPPSALSSLTYIKVRREASAIETFPFRSFSITRSSIVNVPPQGLPLRARASSDALLDRRLSLRQPRTTQENRCTCAPPIPPDGTKKRLDVLPSRAQPRSATSTLCSYGALAKSSPCSNYSTGELLSKSVSLHSIETRFSHVKAFRVTFSEAPRTATFTPWNTP